MSNTSGSSYIMSSFSIQIRVSEMLNKICSWLDYKNLHRKYFHRNIGTMNYGILDRCRLNKDILDDCNLENWIQCNGILDNGRLNKDMLDDSLIENGILCNGTLDIGICKECTMKSWTRLPETFRTMTSWSRSRRSPDPDNTVY